MLCSAVRTLANQGFYAIFFFFFFFYFSSLSSFVQVQQVGLADDVLAALPERPGASDRFVMIDGRYVLLLLSPKSNLRRTDFHSNVHCSIRKLPSTVKELGNTLFSDTHLSGTIVAGLLREVRVSGLRFFCLFGTAAFSRRVVCTAVHRQVHWKHGRVGL